MTPSTSWTRRPDSWGYKLLATLFWLGVWQLASMAVGQEIILPGPRAVVAKLGVLMGTSAFYGSVCYSLSRILLGFALALTAGCALAVLSLWSRAVRTLLHPPMAVISATPIASFAILALVLIGKNNLSVFISFLMALPVIYLNVLRGIDSADVMLIEMADVFRVGKLRRARAIYAPAAFPYLLSASQIALGMCWKSGLAAEVIGQPDKSIGDALYRAKVFLETDSVFAYTIAIILISVVLERLVIALIKGVQARWN